MYVTMRDVFRALIECNRYIANQAGGQQSIEFVWFGISTILFFKCSIPCIKFLCSNQTSDNLLHTGVLASMELVRLNSELRVKIEDFLV